MDTSLARQDLYPPIEPYDAGRIDVDEMHNLYWECCGNPKGVPVIFLHGGPGAGCQPVHRRFFDPEHYRIILFDQRGCGRSRPLGELKDNTTQHLVADMEQLRERLGVESWLVFGGSWGSTLALAYGETYPNRCLGFVLRGVFMCRKREVAWFMGGVKSVFPEAWRAFANYLPEEERGEMLTSYYRRLTHADPSIHGPAARAWCRYENACSTLRSQSASGFEIGVDRAVVALARIEAHYLINEAFMEEGWLLSNVDRIENHPCVIVQGRYDMVCPIATADDLVQAWPGVDYIVVPDGGHSALEPGNRVALISATEKLKNLQR